MCVCVLVIAFCYWCKCEAISPSHFGDKSKKLIRVYALKFLIFVSRYKVINSLTYPRLVDFFIFRFRCLYTVVSRALYIINRREQGKIIYSRRRLHGRNFKTSQVGFIIIGSMELVVNSSLIQTTVYLDRRLIIECKRFRFQIAKWSRS